MNSKFRIKLFFIMITFAIVLLFTVAFIDYKRLKEETVKNHEFQLTRTEESIEYALQTIDKAYYLFDQDTVDLLEQYTLELMERYSVEPDFSEWDFQSLAKKYEADIFIIDEENVIVHSNKEDEIGLDFSKCCKTLETILNERRASGGFHVDGMDVEQSSGDVRRYSYMATEDKKYIIELGYSLQDKAIFEQYNFLSVIDDLVEQYPTIKDIKILNLGGLSFGEETRALTDKRREAFEWTRTSRQTTEIQGEEEFITYRYVHYDTTLEPGITQNKVLEITYDEKDDRVHIIV